MSKLTDLIDRLCPNGVEFTVLGKIAEIKRGIRVIKSNLDTEGNIPVYQNSLAPLGYFSKANFPADTTYVIGAGAAGDIGYSPIPYWGADDCYSIICSDKLLSKYVYYQLLNNQIFLKSRVRTASIPRLARTAIEQFPIAVPPLEVQEEIVRILDTFSTHAAELQAELQARKEQYEYYRNLLLTFNPSACGYGTDDEQEIKNVTTWGGASYKIDWKTMGEIGMFYGGLTGKSKSDFIDGNARFISYMNVYSNIALNQTPNEYVKIGINEKQNKLQYGDAIFTGSSETSEECGMSSVVTHEPKEPLYLNSFCFGFRLIDKSIFVPDFLKHLLRSKSIRDQIKKTANGVTRFNVSKNLFAKVVLPIPPIEYQVKIASILDRFETIVNDLTQGLPAEIAAVKEQYEYYRNKLLTFKQAI